MSFETKYLIRWGIPGWVLIFWILYQVVFLKGIDFWKFDAMQMNKGFAFLISLAAIGVPLGYILHQIYFGVAWVFDKKIDFNKIVDQIGEKFPKHEEWGDNKNEDYYQFEYVWHMVLIKQDTETRAYIESRYRHLLGTIHGLGSLSVSSGISLFITIALIITHSSGTMDYFYFGLGVVFQISILTFSIFNYKYYSANLNAFQKKMFQTYLKNK
ncbi:hypothetical protein [Bacillus sp. CDB3]|uniref:hypothetical protein n=1 Tax=Bacillus sp. CDB3 TaxID=360310 RepID=UPI0009D7B163|nr:hypothetical protein [Bacillus sp. CDB3]OQR54806.1 hypothetical protein CDB3_22415 [Bacillus sp. CDB3]